MPVSSSRKIKTLSLFTGAGGLDIGFHAAGYDVVACVEIDRHYVKTLKENTGVGRTFAATTEILCEDVRKFDATKYSERGIECIIGGPPCQTFSAAGRRSGGVLGTSDARGRLFRSYCQILDVIKPSMFVFENVYGLPGANNGEPWREIVQAFESHGYTLKADVVDAADYGVPQHRERLIMVGFRSGSYEFPLPTHGPDSDSGQGLMSAGEALEDKCDPHEPEHDNLGGLYGHLLPLVPPGLNYAFFTREMGYPEPIFAWRSKFHDFLYKVDPANPSRTIKAKPGKFTGPFHWKNRHFNVEELKRLQSFPDEYTIVGNYGKVVEQIGNSVPPRLAEVIAVSAREQLLDKSQKLAYPVRQSTYAPTFRQRQRERTNHFKSVAKKVIADRFARSIPTASHKQGATTTYTTYEGFFGKLTYSRLPTQIADNTRAFKRVVTFDGKDIAVTFDRLGNKKKNRRVQIEIDGLHKGLTTIRRLVSSIGVADLDEIFFAWEAIEGVLVEKSKFLTLIDIYGHYANRGDTVCIRTDIIGGASSALVRSLRFFGDSLNCGKVITRAEVMRTLGVDATELTKLISHLRTNRFDVRTDATHPTMAPGMVLCTYPFPLLSSKAHLERRLKEDSFDLQDAGIKAGLFD